MINSSTIVLSILLLATLTQAQYNPCQFRANNELINDYSSCQSYFRCVDQVAVKESCLDGFIFSPDMPGCTRCYACPASGIRALPVHNSCTQYVLCVEGEVTYRECPEGTHWNERISNCDLIENANCLETPTPPPTGTTSAGTTPAPTTTRGGPPTAPTVSRY